MYKSFEGFCYLALGYAAVSQSPHRTSSTKAFCLFEGNVSHTLTVLKRNIICNPSIDCVLFILTTKKRTLDACISKTTRRDSVSNHHPHNCLLNRLFKRRSKKTSKRRVAGLCAGNLPVTGEFTAQMASNADFFSIWSLSWYQLLFTLLATRN